MTSPDPGAQGGTGSAQGGAADDGQGTGASQDPGALSGAGDQGGTQTQTPPAATVTQAEFDALRNQLRAADQKRTEAQQALKDLVEKDLPAQEKLKRDFDQAAADRDKYKVDLDKSRIENAFLKHNKFKWQNPDTALKLADLSKVEIGEDGTVLNLVPALEALAKSDPYLLAAETATEDAPRGSTGAPAGGRASDTKADMKALANRIPALRSRGIGG